MVKQEATGDAPVDLGHLDSVPAAVCVSMPVVEAPPVVDLDDHQRYELIIQADLELFKIKQQNLDKEIERERKLRLRSRLKEEFYREANRGKRAVEESSRQADEDAKRKRREQVKEMMDEAERIKSAGPVKLEMKGAFSMGVKSKPVTAKSSAIFGSSAMDDSKPMRALIPIDFTDEDKLSMGIQMADHMANLNSSTGITHTHTHTHTHLAHTSINFPPFLNRQP